MNMDLESRLRALGHLPVPDPEPIDVVARRARRHRNRRLAGLVVPLTVAAAIVATVIVAAQPTRTHGERVQAVDRPPASTPAQARFGGTLAWIDSTAGLVTADAGRATTRGPSGEWCWTCSFVSYRGTAFTAQSGTLYRITTTDPRLRNAGPGNTIFPAPSAGAFYVQNGANLELRHIDGKRSGGPWPIPAGYVLTTPPKAVANGVLLESIDIPASETLKVWAPSTGRLTIRGHFSQLIDTTLTDAHHPSTIASVDCRSATGCPLQLINAKTGTTRKITPPPNVGFIGGGAFTPDGSYLAAFVSDTHGGGIAQLVIVNIATGKLHVVASSDVGLGEAFGYATWTPSGRWVVFGGLHAHMRAYRLGAPRAASLPFPTNYSVIALSDN